MRPKDGAMSSDICKQFTANTKFLYWAATIVDLECQIYLLLFVEQLLVALLFCGQLPVASGSAVLEGSYYQMNNVVFIVSSCCTWVLTLTCQNVLA